MFKRAQTGKQGHDLEFHDAEAIQPSRKILLKRCQDEELVVAAAARAAGGGMDDAADDAADDDGSEGRRRRRTRMPDPLRR